MVFNGRTFHNLFRLPISASKLDPLSPGTLQSLQATLKDCTTLIMDEKSMLSLSVLAFIDQRLRQIFPRAGGRHAFWWNVLKGVG